MLATFAFWFSVVFCVAYLIVAGAFIEERKLGPACAAFFAAGSFALSAVALFQSAPQ